MNIKNQLTRFYEKLQKPFLMRDLKPYLPIINRVKMNQASLFNRSDPYLNNYLTQIIQKYQHHPTDCAFQSRLFACISEVIRRELDLVVFEEQLLAGWSMLESNIAQLPTGEGKTLVAVFPAIVLALKYGRVHVLTVNDYLAKRDATWMTPIYTRFGLDVCAIQETMSQSERGDAYNARIMYGTANEIGFDFLRDNLVYKQTDVVQQPYKAMIIDEIDSILIDEARNPLVVACQEDESVVDRTYIAQVCAEMKQGVHYETDHSKRNVFLTDDGIHFVQKRLACANLFALECSEQLAAINYALHAEVLLKKDIDYLIRDGTIQQIDVLKGRIAYRRKWDDGLQSAIEAKENIAHTKASRILASITIPHLVKKYAYATGMSATAEESAEEFFNEYGLGVIIIPPHQPCKREDYPDQVFTHKRAKKKAIIRTIRQLEETGRPVLVGTKSVAESEYYGAILHRLGIPCSILNAKNPEHEAAIISEAGDLHKVTISTNMAGRGVDIRLGGQNERNRERVVALGGLYVLGTTRHDNQRADNQLRGRAGRQGDPGASCFYTSLEDEFVQKYELKTLLPTYCRTLTQQTPLHDPRINRELDWAQRHIASQFYEARRTLNKYAAPLEQQADEFYSWRNSILSSSSSTTYDYNHTPNVQKYIQQYGEVQINQAARLLMLHCMDQCWADHLKRVEILKEQIVLVANIASNSAGGLWGTQSDELPIQRFIPLCKESYETCKTEVMNRFDEAWATVCISENGLDLERTGIKTPGITWTYLVSDVLYQPIIPRIMKNLQQKIWSQLFRS